MKPPPPVADNNNILPKMDFLLNEVIGLRRFLMLKEICPELIENIAKKTDFPKDEKGEFFQNYIRWQNTSQDVIHESTFGYVFHWLDETAALVNNARYCYQSTASDLEQFYETAFKISQDNTTGAFISNTYCLSKLLTTMNIDNKAEDFFSFFLSELDHRYSDDVWLQTVSLLLLIGKENTAKDILEKFLSLYPSDKIKNYLAVAELACRSNIQGFEFEAGIFNQIMKNTNQKYVQKALSGKKIALIGNGPQEKNKSLGKIIDGYDVVVRMNAYNLTEDYCRDYGRKCDVWYRTFGEFKNERKEKNKGNPEYSILGTPFLCWSYPDYVIRQLAEDLDKGHIVQAVDINDFKSILSKTNILIPSGGALMAAWIKEANADFSLSDCFGLALAKKREPLTNWIRADGTKNPLPVHNMFYEWQQIHKFFKE